jgi:hypothetical protein
MRRSKVFSAVEQTRSKTLHAASNALQNLRLLNISLWDRLFNLKAPALKSVQLKGALCEMQGSNCSIAGGVTRRLMNPSPLPCGRFALVACAACFVGLQCRVASQSGGGHDLSVALAKATRCRKKTIVKIARAVATSQCGWRATFGSEISTT